MTEIPGATGTPIGDMTYLGGLAAAFDGEVSESYANCARGPVNDVDTYCGKDWGEGITKTIVACIVYGSNDYGFCAYNGSYFLYLKGSDNGTDWTTLATLNFTDTNDESGGREFTDINTDNAYRYHAVFFSWGGTVCEQYCAEIRFWEGEGGVGTIRLGSFEITDPTALRLGTIELSAAEIEELKII